MRHFSLEEGMRIQKEQLRFWEAILKPEYFAKVQNQVDYLNELYPPSSGDEVVRGWQINQMINDLEVDCDKTTNS